MDKRSFNAETNVPRRWTKRQSTPWCSILTSVPVWATATGFTGSNWAFYTLLTTLPSYLHQVLRFNISENGVLSALPFLFMGCFEVLGSIAADKIRERELISTHGVRRTFAALGCYVPCTLLIIIGFLGCNQFLVIAVLCVATSFIGLSNTGIIVSVYDIAPRHAGTVMGIVNTFATTPGILAPSIVEAITDSKPLISRWRWMFFMSSALFTIGGTAFIAGCSAKEQDWAKPKEIDTEELIEHDKENSCTLSE